MPGFTCYNRNIQGVNGGGIATCIKNKDVKDTLKVFEGKDDEEMIITRHGQFDIPINVINIYGSQECRHPEIRYKSSGALYYKRLQR